MPKFGAHDRVREDGGVAAGLCRFGYAGRFTGGPAFLQADGGRPVRMGAGGAGHIIEGR